MPPHARAFNHEAPSQTDDELEASQRIYMLGTGSIGKFVAHSLSSVLNPPPVTLIFHKPSLLEEWRKSGQQIQLATAGVTEVRSGFNTELAMPNRRKHGQEIAFGEDPKREFDPRTRSNQPRKMFTDFDAPRGLGTERTEPIYNLIVTTKAPSTVSALSAIAHRLTPASTICFLQNGMGVIDEVNEELFPDEATRPNYMQGIISHGVHSSTAFSATHAGAGTIQLGLLPRGPLTPPAETSAVDSTGEPEDQRTLASTWAPSSRYLLRTLTRSPALCAVGLSPTDLLCAQLEKLAINCLVNPITALLDVRNGTLLYNYHISRAMRLLLSEISLVVRSLPELRGMPNLETRFAAARLETLAVSVADKTGNNISSMLADVRRGLQSEIDYINGYIVRRGDEVGVRCVMNYLVVNLVNGKQNITQREIEEDVTLIGEDDSLGFSTGEGGGRRKV